MTAFAPLLVTLIVLAALPLPYSISGGPILRRAPVTALLLALNIVVFLATHISLSRGLVEPIQAFNYYGLVPADVHPRDLITYAFLHVSGAHVLWNMLYLALFGPSVEEKVGSWLYAALYLLGGAAAGLINSAIVMHFAANSSAAYVPVVGASGAISAVLGLFTIFAASRPLKLFWAMGFLTGQDRHLLQIPAIFGIALWLVQTIYGAALSLINQDAGSVAYFTHLGGFLVGIALGLAAKHARNYASRFTSPTDDHLAPANDAPKAASKPHAPPSDDSSAGTGLLALLDRAVDHGDLPRSEALHAKCRAMGIALPPSLLDRLAILNQNASPSPDALASSDAKHPNGN